MPRQPRSYTSTRFFQSPNAETDTELRNPSDTPAVPLTLLKYHGRRAPILFFRWKAVVTSFREHPYSDRLYFILTLLPRFGGWTLVGKLALKEESAALLADVEMLGVRTHVGKWLGLFGVRFM
jgi:hypothetical protein